MVMGIENSESGVLNPTIGLPIDSISSFRCSIRIVLSFFASSC
jgi:hypothetical protein